MARTPLASRPYRGDQAGRSSPRPIAVATQVGGDRLPVDRTEANRRADRPLEPWGVTARAVRQLVPWGVAIAALSALQALLLLAAPGGHAVVRDIDDLISVAGQCLAALLCLLALRRGDERGFDSRSLGALLFAIGLLCVAGGDAVWAWFALVSGQEAPGVSGADLLYLSSYPLIVAGALLLGRRSPMRFMPPLALLDGLLIATSLLTFCWYVLLGPLLVAAGGLLTGQLLAAVYPLGDLAVLVCLLVRWLKKDVYLPGISVVVFGGAVTVLTADGIVWYQSLHGSYATGGLLDVLWPLGSMLLGLGVYALYQAGRAGAGDTAPASLWSTTMGARRPASGLRSAVLPCALIPALVALAAVTGYQQAQQTIRFGVYVGMGLVTGLAVLRQMLTTLESRDYARSLERLAESLQALHSNNDALLTANRQLEVMAMTDALTGLPNRALLYDRLGQAILGAQRAGHVVGLLLMDLDRFKEVNDTLGHLSGDRLLQQIGARLRAALGTSGVIARLGGDEFAVLLPRTDLDGARRVARSLSAALEQHFYVDGHTLDVGASIGIALFPDHGSDPSTLLRCADVAMYVAKRTQAGSALYVADEDPHSARRLALMGELRRAISQNGLLLYYQPKMDLASNQVTGVEALVRWPHPEYGIVAPDQFIPVAEQTGLIVPLTRWVMETAIAQCRAWRDRGLHLGVAVNLSARSLLDPGLLDLVTDLLEHYALDPARLTLEITESTLMAEPGRALEALMALDAIGVRLAIDDFGTGYSSLAYLKQLPVDEVKIDKAFVLSLNASRHSGAVKDRLILRSVTALAHALGMEVVAEGVENQVAWDVLTGLRCNAAQGFFLSKPVPVGEFEAWLQAAPREFALVEQAR